MLSLDQCSSVLNENGSRYSDSEVKIIRNFLYKMGSLGYEVFQIMKLERKLVVSRWDHLSRNYGELLKMIQLYREMGIEVVSTEQPINMRSPFYRAKLAMYLFDSYEEEEENFIHNRMH